MYSSIALCTFTLFATRSELFPLAKLKLIIYQTRTLHPPPFPQTLASTLLLSVFMKLTTLGISYILAWEIPWTAECDGV